MSGIQIQGIRKVYPNGFEAVKGIDLDIAGGEFMVLVGPSGCGKSTLLRMIAGLEEISEGTLLIDGNDVTDVAPRQRDIAMVFQNYALYPHMTVRDNLGFGLKLRRTDKKEIKRRVDEVAAMLGLEPMLDRKPAALSGGQRQRVAIGRAIVREPKAFLMDEPLSNLDAKLRVTMRAELARLHARLQVTTVYVTHDQVEAMTLGQRVAVMRDGILQQCDTPQELFDHPANLFVAAFIGSPSMNLVQATISGDQISFADHTLTLVPGSSMIGHDGEVILGIRPTSFEFKTPQTDPGLPSIRVKADVLEELGADTNVIFSVAAPPVRTDAVAAAADVDDANDAQLIADDTKTPFTARVDGRHNVRVGDEIDLVVDTARLHFFDIEGGTVLGDPIIGMKESVPAGASAGASIRR
jgi:multiple sugar transport system ATP-binding protein